MMNPSKLNAKEVMNRNNNITNGCNIVIGTKRNETARIIRPSAMDFVVAAPTYPTTISHGEIGADSGS